MFDDTFMLRKQNEIFPCFTLLLERECIIVDHCCNQGSGNQTSSNLWCSLIENQIVFG